MCDLITEFRFLRLISEDGLRRRRFLWCDMNFKQVFPKAHGRLYSRADFYRSCVVLSSRVGAESAQKEEVLDYGWPDSQLSARARDVDPWKTRIFNSFGAACFVNAEALRGGPGLLLKRSVVCHVCAT